MFLGGELALLSLLVLDYVEQRLFDIVIDIVWKQSPSLKTQYSEGQQQITLTKTDSFAFILYRHSHPQRNFKTPFNYFAISLCVKYF